MYTIVYETYLNIERQRQYGEIVNEGLIGRLRMALSKVRSSDKILSFAVEIQNKLAIYEDIKPNIQQVENGISLVRTHLPTMLSFTDECGIVLSYIKELKNGNDSTKIQKFQYDILNRINMFIKRIGWTLTLNNITNEDLQQMKLQISTFNKTFIKINIFMVIDQVLFIRSIINKRYTTLRDACKKEGHIISSDPIISSFMICLRASINYANIVESFIGIYRNLIENEQKKMNCHLEND